MEASILGAHGSIGMSKQSSENRVYKRWDIFEYALLKQNDESLSEPAIIVDLSLGGLQVRGKRAYKEGEICEVSIIDDKDRQIVTNAEIRYSRPLPDSNIFVTGLRFAPGTTEERVSLVNYIHAKFQANADTLAM